MSENDLAGSAVSVWSWLKRHLLTLLLFLALVVCVYTVLSQKSSMSSVLNEYSTQLTESHNNIAALEETVIQERTAREQMQREFNERITDIDTRYTKAISDIRRERTRRIRALMDDTSTLDSRFGERFGISE